jgi:O-antigen ligase
VIRLFAPLGVLRALFSFEMLFVLAIISGVYVNDPRLAGLPVKPGYITFAAAGAVGALIFVRQRLYSQSFYLPFIALCFVTWVAVSNTWSPSSEYAIEKTFHLVFFGLWPLIACALIVASDPPRVRRFQVAWLIACVWVAADAIQLYYSEAVVYSLELRGANYIAINRLMSFAAIIALVAWLFGDRWSGSNLISFSLFALFCFVLLITGGRGPLFGLAAALLVALLIGLGTTRRGILYHRYQLYLLGIIALIAGGLAVALEFASDDMRTIQRMMILFEEVGGGRSASARLTTFHQAFELWSEATLLGHGVGSFPVMTGVGDVRHYPHNLILELLAEVGLVGFCLFAAMLVTAMRNLWLSSLRTDPAILCGFMLLVNALVNAMFSSDLPGNRLVFVALGLLAICDYKRQREPQGRKIAAKPWLQRVRSAEQGLGPRPDWPDLSEPTSRSIGTPAHAHPGRPPNLRPRR